MSVIQGGLAGRWAAMSADPERARQIRAAARRREQAAARPMALATAPPANVEPIGRGSAPADLMPMPAWLARSVRNAAGPARIDLLDEVGPWGVTAADFAAGLAKIPPGTGLTLGISSPGGEVFDGLAIHNQLRQWQGTVRVEILGLAASVASVIAMAASPGQLYIAPTASVMIHSAWAATIGDEDDHRQVADLLDGQSANIASIYAGRTGQPASVMRAAMKAETWYIGQEAVTAGLADGILPATGSASEPDDWATFAAALTASGGPGRPGNAELRHRAYNRFVAQPGRDQGRVSPFIAAVFRR